MYTPEDLLKLMNATGYRTQEEIAEAVDVTDRTIRYWLTKGVTSPRAVDKLDRLEPRPAFRVKFEAYQAERQARLASSNTASPAASAPTPAVAEMSWEAPPGTDVRMPDERLRKFRLPTRQPASPAAPNSDSFEMSWEAPPGTDARVPDERPRKLRLASRQQPESAPFPRTVRTARRRWGRFAVAGMVAGFAVLPVLILVCTFYLAGRSAPGAFWFTRGSGVAEEGASSVPIADEPTDAPAPSSIEEASPIAGRSVPDHPLKGQMLEPCPSWLDAINGGCWAKTAHLAPCPNPKEYEHTGQCYFPEMQAPRPHNTFEPKDAGQ